LIKLKKEGALERRNRGSCEKEGVAKTTAEYSHWKGAKY